MAATVDHVTLTARSVVAGSVLVLEGSEYSPLIFAVGAGANWTSQGASATTRRATRKASSEMVNTRFNRGRHTVLQMSGVQESEGEPAVRRLEACSSFMQ